MPSGLDPATVGTPRRGKGARVFLDYDQSELDAAYDQARYAPNAQQVQARYAANSNAARTRIGEPQRLAYGPTPVETLDLYPARAAGAPVFVFVHGGAWRAGTARNYAFVAEMLVAAGAHCAILDFITAQEAGGDLSVMVNQVRRAVAWTYRNARSFGGDPGRLYLGGHSSGAHLASVCLVTAWERDFGLPRDLIKGALCSSGIYDLKPVRLSARSTYLKLDDATENALSAERHAARLEAPVLVSYGTAESPEFQRQARDFVAAIRAAGRRADLLSGEHYNHFEILETLGNPYGLLGRALLKQMNLA